MLGTECGHPEFFCCFPVLVNLVLLPYKCFYDSDSGQSLPEGFINSVYFFLFFAELWFNDDEVDNKADGKGDEKQNHDPHQARCSIV